MAYAPDRIRGHQVLIAKHNWQKNWMKVRQQLRHFGFHLDFVFDSIFRIPNNFNRISQKIEAPVEEFEEPIVIKTIYQLPLKEPDRKKFQIQIDGKWQNIVDIDYINNMAMLENGEIVEIPKNNIKMRKRKI